MCIELRLIKKEMVRKRTSEGVERFTSEVRTSLNSVLGMSVNTEKNKEVWE